MNTPPRKQSERGMFRPVWREFNRLIDYVRETQVASGRNVKVTRTMNGTMLVGEAEGVSTEKAKHYRLKEILPDYLRCRTWGGTNEIADDGETDIYIARDPELRRTRYDGRTIAFSSDGDAFTAVYAYTSNTKRTKTVTGTAEVQVIVPYYKVDETVITAIEAVTKVENPDGAKIGLLEITQRAWAKI